jgi:murein hydrolase activator
MFATHARVRLALVIAFTVVALGASARADPRAQLVEQFAAELAAIERARQLVGDKLAELDRARATRLATAARLVRTPADRDPMTTARRLGFARAVVDRDLAERALLVAEADQLRAAAARVAADAARVPALALPPRLERPVRGSIARGFGELVHERSKARLARRGIDFDVEARAPVAAPADGVVRYAGPIRGLGSGLMIDHGAYVTVLAKLGELAVSAGARVARGERLGRAARHRVYFEVRVAVGAGGRPIDPAPLLD